MRTLLLTILLVTTAFFCYAIDYADLELVINTYNPSLPSHTDLIHKLSSVGEDIIPSTTCTYDLGSTTKEWKSIYFNDTVSGPVVDTQYIEYTSGGTLTVRDDLDLVDNDLITAGTMTAKGYTQNLVSKTGAYTLTAVDDIVLGNTNAFTLTLPTASGITGKVYTIKKINTEYDEALTIDGASSETIDGNETHILYTVNSGITIASDGTNWQITGSF